MSRRMKGRHAKAVAQPDADPNDVETVELDEDNSVPDTNGLGIRYPKQLNTRNWVTAGEDETEREESPARRRRRKSAAADDDEG